ncbi:MAG: oxidoreductase [Pirellulales bacterium]|nr:oxidoreductase [Pirellulales bacterium]
MSDSWWMQQLGRVVMLAPAVQLGVVGAAMLAGRPLGEKRTARLAQASVSVGLLAAIGVLGLMLLSGARHVEIEFGHWVEVSKSHFGEPFHFHLKFVFDRLSVPLVILSYVLVGVIGAFATRYLHRERGFARFFLLYSVFLAGMVVAVMAGTVETLFLGWELVGLSSALLVAFFHERPAPVENGQRVWAVYRVADAAFLVAAVALHHATGAGDFAAMTGSEPWPHGQALLSSQAALGIGVLLLAAAAGKSALVPFSGWLPRAMEGPTPSSAVFYGALSVHLGTFLLLRFSPVLELSLALRVLVIGLGLATAVYGAVVSRVQPDVKTALAFASLTQVGLITAEIGCGLRYVPLVHMIGHACFRTLQLLRTPSLLQDHSTLENAIGRRLGELAAPSRVRLPLGARRRLYRWALERGRLDAMLDRFVVTPFLELFRWCHRRERQWTNWLAGGPPRCEADPCDAEDLESDAA